MCNIVNCSFIGNYLKLAIFRYTRVVDKNNPTHCKAVFLSISVNSGYFWLHMVVCNV
jgi:hypothetical protein